MLKFIYNYGRDIYKEKEKFNMPEAIKQQKNQEMLSSSNDIKNIFFTDKFIEMIRRNVRY